MKKIKKAFTLVELMVVIAILAILAGVSIVGYSSFIDKEKERSAITEATQAREIIIAEVIKQKNEISFDIAPNGKVTLNFDNGELYVKTEPGIIHNESKDADGFDKMLRKTFPSLAPLPGFFTIDGSVISYHSDYDNPNEDIIVDVVTGEVLKHKDKDSSSSGEGSGGEGSGTETPSTSSRVTAIFGQSYLKMSPGTPFTILYEVTGPAGTISSLTQSGDSVSFVNNGSSITITAIKEGTTYIFLSATDGKNKAEAKLTVIVDKDSKTPVALPIQKTIITYDGKEHGKFENATTEKMWDIPAGVALIDSQPGTEPTGTGSPENHYYATFKITDDTKYCWAIDATSGTQLVEWKINKIELAKPYQVNHPTFLDGANFDDAKAALGKEKEPEWDNGTWRTLYEHKPKLITIGGETGRERPGKYRTTFTLTNEAYNHYCWKDNKDIRSIDVEWYVYKEEVAIPTIIDNVRVENGVYIYEYKGGKITPNVKTPWNGSVTKSGDTSATKCGNYEINLALDLVVNDYSALDWFNYKDVSDCFEWEDGTISDKQIKWAIIPKVLQKPVQNGTLQYTGRERTASWKESYGNYVTITGNKQTNAGEYTATFTLTDTNNYKWADSTTAIETASWKIEKAVVNTPIEDGKAYEYKSRQEYGPEKSSDYNIIFKLVSGTGKASTQGDYTSVLELIDPNNYKWSNTDDKQITINWSIMHHVDVPFNNKTSNTFDYDGSEHNPVSSYDKDALDVTITGGDCVAPGTYTATFKLKDKCAWSDGTTGDKSFTWTINKASVPVPVAYNGKTSFEYDGTKHCPTWNVADNSLVAISGNSSNIIKVGKYQTTFTLKDSENSAWSDGTTGVKTINWEITKAIIPIPTVVNNGNTSFEYDGKQHYPTWNVRDNKLVETSGANANRTNAGDYTTVFKLVDPVNSCWADGTTTDKQLDWKITVKLLTIPTVNRVSSSGFWTKTYTATFNNYNTSYMTVTGNSGNKSSGTATFSLIDKSGKNYKWADGKTTDKTVNWKK